MKNFRVRIKVMDGSDMFVWIEVEAIDEDDAFLKAADSGNVYSIEEVR